MSILLLLHRDTIICLADAVRQVPLGHGDRVDPDEGGDNIYNTM